MFLLSCSLNSYAFTASALNANEAADCRDLKPISIACHRPSILTHTHTQKPAFEDNNQFYTKAVNSSTHEWKKTLLLRCVLLRFFNFFFKKIYSINIYVYVYAYACMCALKIFCVLFTVFISFFFEFFLTLLACFVLAAYIADRVSLLRLAFLL